MKKALLLLFFAVKVSAAPVGVGCDANGNLTSFTGTDGSSRQLRAHTEADSCTSNCSPAENPAISSVGAALSATNPGKLRITYPLKGPNRQIQSSNYDTDAIQKLVEVAIQNDLDPYMLISIVLIESPPVNGNGGGTGYSVGYGDLPIDGLPVYEALGCFARKNTSTPPRIATAAQVTHLTPLYQQRDRFGNGFKARFSEYSKFRDFIVRQFGGGDGPEISRAIKKLHDEFPNGCPIADIPRAVSDKFCSDPQIRSVVALDQNFRQSENTIDAYLQSSGVSETQRIELQARLDRHVAGAIIPNETIPEFRLPQNGNKSTFLCAQPYAYNHGTRSMFSKLESPDPNQCCTKVSGYSDENTLKRDFLNLMAANFVKEKMRVSAGTLAGLSLDLQKYNGTGVIGSTEGVNNNCIGGIHMGSRPYYGARVSDLMINSVLSNSQIHEMIKKTSASLRKPVTSMFCKKLGRGNHSINSTLFFDQQKSFLLSGQSRSSTSGGQRFEYKTKLASGSVGIPQSAQDLRNFSAVESKRAKTCAKFFN